MSTERTTPYGMWRYGNDFRRASLYVRDGVDDKYFMPYYFLVGQSIELSFKAFLMGRGESIEELRKRFGHNLKALSAEARLRQIGREVKLDRVHFGVIDLLSYEYTKHRFRYFEAGTMAVPDVTLIQAASDRLSEGLRTFCYKETKW